MKRSLILLICLPFLCTGTQICNRFGCQIFPLFTESDSSEYARKTDSAKGYCYGYFAILDEHSQSKRDSAITQLGFTVAELGGYSWIGSIAYRALILNLKEKSVGESRRMLQKNISDLFYNLHPYTYEDRISGEIENPPTQYIDTKTGLLPGTISFFSDIPKTIQDSILETVFDSVDLRWSNNQEFVVFAKPDIFREVAFFPGVRYMDVWYGPRITNTYVKAKILQGRPQFQPSSDILGRALKKRMHRAQHSRAYPP